MADTNKAFNEENILEHAHRERLKELAAINRTSGLLKEGRPLDDTFQQLCFFLPEAWQYPEFTCIRIRYNGKVYTSQGFLETKWSQMAGFESFDGKKGSIEVFYTREFMEIDEGPFMKEERDLINNLAGLITGYLNSMLAREVFKIKEEKAESCIVPGTLKPGRKLLHQFLNKNNYDRDIYHDLMPYKVREILLVATLYDAYSIEREGRFSEYVLGEYHQLNLTSLPRITGVSSEEEVFEQLYSKHYDLIIFMVGVDKKLPVRISHQVREKFPYIPIFFLLNNNQDVSLFHDKSYPFIDRLFVWNGDSKVFFSMIKHLEDKINAENDTRIGMVRVILLVEDSPIYYTRYLPMLYSVVMEQTKRIIDDVTTDELYRVLKLRARPKILLATNYEEAIEITEKYKDYLLCLISDMSFRKNGVDHPMAGYELVSHVKSRFKDLPVILQSSDPENARLAFELKSTFIDKNSDSLLQDFRSFITHYLGFGNFVYRNSKGVQIAVAHSLKEFEKQLRVIPDDSLLYHARRNHFSLWLMARGEIQVAKIINPAKVSDFKSPQELREYLIDVIQKFRNEQNQGKVIPFEESAINDESNILLLTEGALGGKGRGLAFVNTLIYNFDFHQLIPNINIRTPKTSIIGADEFEYFLDRNNLREVLDEHITEYEFIRENFAKGHLSEGLIKKLKLILKNITKPLAIRSSGLFEDSLAQPFAGIFETYILPNNHPDLNVRLEQCMSAIKLVYASVYSPVARAYIEAVHYKIEEEKMAVVIQELVGNQFDEYYYPHISGVAQSYNFYPFGHMNPEDGFAVAALGLGTYVVQGEKAYRFCPKYPTLDINTPKDQYKNSQVYFYAVNLKNKDINLMEGEDAGLIKLDIDVAETHGSIKHLASVYDRDNERIVPGLSEYGPRIINFADILKYQYIPLAETIADILEIVQEALGSPVEIEFAVDLTKDNKNRASFYLLQIKPLFGSAQDFEFEADNIPKDEIILYTVKGMGNGMIDNLTDVIYVDYQDFDKSKTREMAAEIDKINSRMVEQNKNYILIGPGRWGTRDQWIGIPVAWPQISSAKVIVETSFEDFPLDASSGSHFFHNVTSMNVGYFTIQQEYENQWINWDLLKKGKLVSKYNFFTHVCFEQPLKVMMDGKKRIAVIKV
ncbi:MAG TPA: PEP/pyruvate-binding domain-containing protein [Bacteroidia bacterium]|nr:PEP/pyruvate-binding domain-containing protein [Bacteroidia bacterium]